MAFFHSMPEAYWHQLFLTDFFKEQHISCSDTEPFRGTYYTVFYHPQRRTLYAKNPSHAPYPILSQVRGIHLKKGHLFITWEAHPNLSYTLKIPCPEP